MGTPPPGRSGAALGATSGEPQTGVYGRRPARRRANAPTRPDAGAPPAPPVSWRLAAGDSALAHVATAVAAGRGWSTTVSPATPNSDHWPFAARGVPAVFIVPGNEWENTTPEARAALRQRWDRYHQAGDRWHPDFPFAGLGRYAEFAMMLGYEVGSRTHNR